ncbi:sperm flagellar protein 2-like [Rhinatrema bivittatum]|uniref:sperm flagellar protein 2-like n=1 Tax=Rhinatrema bivittatum TaxID=194408 RepID=UPI001129E0ED|nr:sperm flagellar protein 2-like [Rhinatrema bivittatum]
MEDDETKAELHQRVFDLRDRLWNICDNRKEEAEQERDDIMNDSWLQDHIGILVNDYFSLMQVEVDRFQDTARLLRDYYQGMEGIIPSDTSQDFVRISLLDIINGDSVRDAEKPKRIPLISRRPQSPEPIAVKAKTKGTPGRGKDDTPGKGKEEISASPLLTYETDEKLINDVWQIVVSAVSNWTAAEIHVREAEEEKDRRKTESKQRNKTSRTPSRSSGKGVKKKASKAKKKGSASPEPVQTPTSPTQEDNPELLRKKELKKKMQEEYIYALEFEDAAVKSRLELIKLRALTVVQNLSSKAENTYKDMEKYLGERFLAEMSSIDKMIYIAEHHIETASKLQNEFVLDQTEFYINDNVKLFRDPDSPPRPPSVEKQVNVTLTVFQLNALYQQLLQVASGAFISSKAFIDILFDLTTLNLGADTLPDLWMHLSYSQLQELASTLTFNSDVIDWRKFLLAAAQPWPYPSLNDLLKLLKSFKAIDKAGEGTFIQDDYDQVELWFTSNIEIDVPENPAEPLPFNRLEHLIKFFFTLFADQNTFPPQLNYMDMLLCFASHPDPKRGFYRALGILAEIEIRRIEGDSYLNKEYVAPSEIDDDILDRLYNGRINLAALLKAFKYGTKLNGDKHRFSSEENEESEFEKQLIHIYEEFSLKHHEPVALKALLRHPVIQDKIENCQQYKLPNIQVILQKVKQMNTNEKEMVTSATS